MVAERSTTSEPHGSTSPATASSPVRSWADASQEVVDEHPVAVVLTAFAAGLAAGTAVGLAISAHTRSRTGVDSVAGKIGERVMHAVNEYVPEAVRSRLPW
jgi:hypothetical protein